MFFIFVITVFIIFMYPSLFFFKPFIFLYLLKGFFTFNRVATCQLHGDTKQLSIITTQRWAILQIPLACHLHMLIQIPSLQVSDHVHSLPGLRSIATPEQMHISITVLHHYTQRTWSLYLTCPVGIFSFFFTTDPAETIEPFPTTAPSKIFDPGPIMHWSSIVHAWMIDFGPS